MLSCKTVAIDLLNLKHKEHFCNLTLRFLGLIIKQSSDYIENKAAGIEDTKHVVHDLDLN